ncbi:MAG TPA: TetR family transcriptional regulator [Polyangiaceae bacterium]|nr:TetR family transcriptional regulator [Polyangiaceae bacterium]
MPTAARFQRARKPDEKAQRREAILEAAAQLFDEKGLDGVSLNAVARQVGIAKSNVYRYFDSREAIFLALLSEDQAAGVTLLEEALARLPADAGIAGAARVLAARFVSAPRLSALMTALSTVLEQNVSYEEVVLYKRNLMRLGLRVGNALRAVIPALPAHAVPAVLKYTHAGVAGLYPLAHPAPSAARALREPDLAPLRVDFGADLEAFFVAILTLLCAAK